MGIFIPVDSSDVKECQLCGQHILFIERREGGLWFPTDAIWDDETESWGYQSRGSRKEVALLHKCYGDSKDPTTINGRRLECRVLTDSVHERLENLRKRMELSPGNNEFKSEYERILVEYSQIRERFSDINVR